MKKMEEYIEEKMSWRNKEMNKCRNEKWSNGEMKIRRNGEMENARMKKMEVYRNEEIKEQWNAGMSK